MGALPTPAQIQLEAGLSSAIMKLINDVAYNDYDAEDMDGPAEALAHEYMEKAKQLLQQ